MLRSIMAAWRRLQCQQSYGAGEGACEGETPREPVWGNTQLISFVREEMETAEGGGQ